MSIGKFSMIICRKNYSKNSMKNIVRMFINVCQLYRGKHFSIHRVIQLLIHPNIMITIVDIRINFLRKVSFKLISIRHQMNDIYSIYFFVLKQDQQRRRQQMKSVVNVIKRTCVLKSFDDFSRLCQSITKNNGISE